MDKIALDRLNQLRIERGETFKSLENDLGISDSTLSKWYSGKSEPSTRDLELLASHYNLTIPELYASVPLSSVPQEKQQDMDIVLRIIDECNAEKAFQTQHCQMLLDHQKELRRLEQENHNALMAQHEAHYSKVVSYLKAQVDKSRTTSNILIIFLVLSLLFSVYLVFLCCSGQALPSAHGLSPWAFIVPLVVLLLVCIGLILYFRLRSRLPHSPAE